MQNQKDAVQAFNSIVVVCLVVSIISILIFEIRNGNNSLISGSTALRLTPKFDTISFNPDDRTTAYAPVSGSGGYYLATKDSVSYYDSKNVRIWGEVHSIANPVMVSSGDYVAVTEIKSKQLAVYGINGKIYQTTFDYPILTFTVNEEGYSAVILQNGSYYEPVIFDMNGKIIGGGELRSSTSFPLSIALSKDSLMSSINYLSIDDIYMNSRINFSYVYKDSGGDFTNGVFAEFTNKNENELIGTMKFISNNELVYISDKEIGFLAPEDSNGEIFKWSFDLTNSIDKIAFGNNLFAITVSQPLTNTDAFSSPTVLFYNYNGEKVGEHTINQPATYISSSKYGFIVVTGRTAYVFNEKGEHLWTYNSNVTINEMMHLNSTNTVLLVTQTSATVMERTRNSANASSQDYEEYENYEEYEEYKVYETDTSTQTDLESGAENISEEIEINTQDNTQDNIESSTEEMSDLETEITE